MINYRLKELKTESIGNKFRVHTAWYTVHDNTWEQDVCYRIQITQLEGFSDFNNSEKVGDLFIDNEHTMRVTYDDSDLFAQQWEDDVLKRNKESDYGLQESMEYLLFTSMLQDAIIHIMQELK